MSKASEFIKFREETEAVIKTHLERIQPNEAGNKVKKLYLPIENFWQWRNRLPIPPGEIEAVVENPIDLQVIEDANTGIKAIQLIIIPFNRFDTRLWRYLMALDQTVFTNLTGIHQVRPPSDLLKPQSPKLIGINSRINNISDLVQFKSFIEESQPA